MVLVLYEVMEAAEMNGLGIIDLSKYLVHTVRSQVVASTQRKYGDPCSTTPTNECLSPTVRGGNFRPLKLHDFILASYPSKLGY
jgi:hypothetical protein